MSTRSSRIDDAFGINRREENHTPEPETTDEVIQKYVAKRKQKAYQDRKKQVGVWLPVNLADELEQARKKLNTTNSQLTEDALRRFFSELKEAGVL